MYRVGSLGLLIIWVIHAWYEWSIITAELMEKSVETMQLWQPPQFYSCFLAAFPGKNKSKRVQGSQHLNKQACL